FPAGPIARTPTVGRRPASADARVSGLVHELQLPPSIRHSKVEPVSEELKVKFGVVLSDGFAGCVPMVVSGAVRSTVHVYVAGEASVLPAWSVARTSKV